MLDRTVEIGIISFRPADEQLHLIGVYTDSVVFVVNPRHPLAREKKVAIDDLGAENFVAHNVASPLRRRVIDLFERHKTPSEHECRIAQP